MRITHFSRSLAIIVGVLGALNTVAELSLPAAAHPPSVRAVLFWEAVLVAHALMYWYGERLRARTSITAYLPSQAGLAFGLGATGAPFGLTLAVFVGLTAEALLLSQGRWSSIAITVISIAIFTGASAIGSTLYQGAGAGVVLATVGIAVYSSAALLRTRQGPAVDVQKSSSAAPPVPHWRPVSQPALTDREQEVLRALASGARTRDIAEELRITERTVKAHLSSIYQKLGVTSRAEAIARLAMQSQSSGK
jgi:DNA-binding CsgD family transcriptional regulator